MTEIMFEAGAASPAAIVYACADRFVAERGGWSSSEGLIPTVHVPCSPHRVAAFSLGATMLAVTVADLEARRVIATTPTTVAAPLGLWRRQEVALEFLAERASGAREGIESWVFGALRPGRVERVHHVVRRAYGRDVGRPVDALTDLVEAELVGHGLVMVEARRWGTTVRTPVCERFESLHSRVPRVQALIRWYQDAHPGLWDLLLRDSERAIRSRQDIG